MCGINGIVRNNLDFKKGGTLKALLKTMNNEIIHRGPDDEGVFIEVDDFRSIALGMRRLSIIDLSNGTQPMYSDDNNVIIVFNGEIYNFKKLKKELEKKNILFKTNCDTEVILKMYLKEGIKSFSKLDGMFAFSIYDKIKNKIYIVRDYFGEKPLYYTKRDNSFIWASELKSIIKVLPQKPLINKKGLNIFLQLTYIPAPYTIYEGIEKLEPNNYIEIDCKSLDFQINKISQNFKEYSINSKQEAIKITHDLVQKSVKSRSFSDVPLGTFLSGGVDSSIISLCLAQQSINKIDTFSIGFNKKSFDETNKSRSVAKLINSNHHEFRISEDDLSQNISEIITNFDEPFADSSCLASHIVASKTKQYVKVALTGDGGDEVFGGYNKYYIGKLNSIYTSVIPKKLHLSFTSLIENVLSTSDDNRGYRLKAKKFLKSIDYEGNFYYKIISLGFEEDNLKDILIDDYLKPNSLFLYRSHNQSKTLTDFRNLDRIISLEGDMLVKVDRTSMISSLECRAPFLNKEIWNLTNQIPEKYLINGWDKKHILKEAFKQYFPKGFLDKSKKGFEVPVGDWLRSTLKNELISYIDKTFIEKQNIFKYNSISNLINNHLDGKLDNTFKVWTFYCFQKWYNFNFHQ